MVKKKNKSNTTTKENSKFDTTTAKYILDFVNATTILLFVATSMFDLAITFSSYIRDPFFLEKEMNFLLVWGIKKGIPFWINPAIAINFSLPLILLYFREKLYQNGSNRFLMGYIIILSCLLISSAIHVIGGLTWLIQ